MNTVQEFLKSRTRATLRQQEIPRENLSVVDRDGKYVGHFWYSGGDFWYFIPSHDGVLFTEEILDNVKMYLHELNVSKDAMPYEIAAQAWADKEFDEMSPGEVAFFAPALPFDGRMLGVAFFLEMAGFEHCEDNLNHWKKPENQNGS